MTQTSSAKTPLAVTIGFVAVGVVLAAIGGFGGAMALVGGLVAAAGVIPAGWATWTGMQQESQAPLGLALLLLFVSLGVGALLIIIWLLSAVF